jgi:hypothetical protein
MAGDGSDGENEVIYYGESLLQVNHPNTGFVNVGMPDRPIAIKAPEGWRVYPGCTARVLQKQPDGTWLDVLWSPNIPG